MQETNKEKKRRKREPQENYNPFNDFSFWLTLATIDFGFFDDEKIQNQAEKELKPTTKNREKKDNDQFL